MFQKSNFSETVLLGFRELEHANSVLWLLVVPLWTDRKRQAAHTNESGFLGSTEPSTPVTNLGRQVELLIYLWSRTQLSL